MKAAVEKFKNAGVAGLLMLLVGVCVLSMAGVTTFYHLTLGRVVGEASSASTAVQNELRQSQELIESLAITQNALQTLLRERDPDVIEKLVSELDARQRELADRINALGVKAWSVRTEFDAWSTQRDHIVQTFLRGESAPANSELVNRLMPLSERVLTGIRNVGQSIERDAAGRSAAMQTDLARTRDRAVIAVAIAAGVLAFGGFALRRQVVRGMGTVADALGRLSTLRAANEVLEERVRQRTELIARTNAQLDAIYQTSLDGILVLDDQWRVKEMNPAAQTAFECSAADAVGKDFSDLIPPSDECDTLNHASRAALLGKRVEVFARRFGTATFPAEIAVTAAKLDGPPLYIVALRDISERRRAEAERDDLNGKLLVASRRAGMADVATGVLHNVGNVLNSVNVAASVISNKLESSETKSLSRLAEMIAQHKQDLSGFLINDDRGKLVPEFIQDLANCLRDEQNAIASELTTLVRGVEHIKQTISAQQSLAKHGGVLTPTDPGQLMDLAMSMQSGSLNRHEIEVLRHVQTIPPFPLDKHKLLQIIINLISNAKHALKASANAPRRMTLTVEAVGEGTGRRVRFIVADNGVGIPPENMKRLFSYGFTTKKDGHGFGLHNAANAAKEIGGSLTAASDGPNRGAAFTLEIPASKPSPREPAKETPCPV